MGRVSSTINAILMVMLLSQQKAANAFGRVDYNDECENFDLGDPTTYVSRLDEWKYCDTNRGLECVHGLGRCGCVVPYTIYRGGKCRAKVNAGCIIKDYKLECVEHATCTRNASSLTFRCQCDRGYLSNAELTSCFSRYQWDYRRRNWYRDRDGFYYFGSGQKPTPMTLTVFALLVFQFIFPLYFHTDF